MTEGHPDHPYPPEYVDMKLCEYYHCLPSQLFNEDAHIIALQSQMRAIEAGTEAKPMSRL